MAIVIDQVNLGSTSDNTSATTVAFTTGAAVAANGFIVVTVTWYGAGITLSSVSGGSLTWTIDLQGASTSDTNAHCAVVSAQAPAGLASSTALTANFSATTGGRSICGSSFTGVLSSAALDTTNGPTNFTGGTGWTTGSTTIGAGSLLIAVAFGINTNDTSTVTAPSIEAHDIPGGAGTFGSTTCYRIEAAGGAFTVAGTWSGTEVGVVCAAAYKAAPVAGGSAPSSRVVPLWLRRFDLGLKPFLGFPLPSSPLPAVDVTVNPSIGVLTLTADAPVVAEAVSPAIGVLTLSAPAPAVTFGGSVSPSIGTLTLSAVSPAVTVSTTPSIGTLTLSADAPTVAEKVTPTIGTLTLSSVAATVVEQVTPTIGTLILGADAPTPTSGGSPVTVSPTIGVLTLTADAPAALAQVTPSIGTLTLLGTAPTVREQVTPSIGTLTLTADAPTVAIAVKPSIGTLALTADAPNIANRSINVPTGVLTLSADSPTPTGGTSAQPTDRDYRLPFFGLP